MFEGEPRFFIWSEDGDERISAWRNTSMGNSEGEFFQIIKSIPIGVGGWIGLKGTTRGCWKIGGNPGGVRSLEFSDDKIGFAVRAAGPIKCFKKKKSIGCG